METQPDYLTRSIIGLGFKTMIYTHTHTKANETKGGLHLSLISLEIEDLVSYAVPTSRKGNVNEYYHHAAKKGKLAT
jgi:hypothetical protein